MLKRGGFSGKEAEALLDQVGITVNKNTIPFEQESPPFVTSGIRLGTPALTTRGGMGTDEMRVIGRLIAQTLERGGRKDFGEIKTS